MDLVYLFVDRPYYSSLLFISFIVLPIVLFPEFIPLVHCLDGPAWLTWISSELTVWNLGQWQIPCPKLIPVDTLLVHIGWWILASLLVIPVHWRNWFASRRCPRWMATNVLPGQNQTRIEKFRHWWCFVHLFPPWFLCIFGIFCPIDSYLLLNFFFLTLRNDKPSLSAGEIHPHWAIPTFLSSSDVLARTSSKLSRIATNPLLFGSCYWQCYFNWKRRSPFPRGTPLLMILSSVSSMTLPPLFFLDFQYNVGTVDCFVLSFFFVFW